VRQVEQVLIRWFTRERGHPRLLDAEGPRASPWRAAQQLVVQLAFEMMWCFAES
jgi:hypothetical protein